MPLPAQGVQASCSGLYEKWFAKSWALQAEKGENELPELVQRSTVVFLKLPEKDIHMTWLARRDERTKSPLFCETRHYTICGQSPQQPSRDPIARRQPVA